MDGISKERVGALSDGVIAIAATLLVLDLAVPEGDAMTHEVVLHWLRVFAGWIISFTMIAILWFDNHFLMAQTTRWTVRLAQLTFLQLALVSLIPFAANLITDYPRDIAAALAFDVIMLANGLVSAYASGHIARSPDLHVGPHVAAAMEDRARFQTILYIVIALLGALGAWLHHPFLGVLLWIFSPLALNYLRPTWAHRWLGTHKDKPSAR